MIRWLLLIAIALTTISGCNSARSESTRGASSLRPLPMNSELRVVPVPTDNSFYLWADPL